MKINDEYIIDYFFYYKNNERLNHKKLESIPNDIFLYLENRFNEFRSVEETLIRIKNNIEIIPKCEICGKILDYTGLPNIPYRKTCSKICNKKQVLKTYKNTCLNKYGVENISQLESIKQKKKETCFNHYNTYFPIQNIDISNKIIGTKLEKYGNKNNYKKIRETKLIKYNDENFNNIEKCKETCLKKYRVDNIRKSKEFKEKLNWDEIIKKQINTKRKNNTFNISKIEKLSFKILKEKYFDVKYQYKSEKYPFNCDFYIPTLDLYLECNYHWTHGGHPYDENNIEDQKKLKEWKTKNTKYYNNAIITWTIRDVNKRNIALNNNLNYVEFYNINELKKWIIKGDI